MISEMMADMRAEYDRREGSLRAEVARLTQERSVLLNAMAQRRVAYIPTLVVAVVMLWLVAVLGTQYYLTLEKLADCTQESARTQSALSAANARISVAELSCDETAQAALAQELAAADLVNTYEELAEEAAQPAPENEDALLGEDW